MVRKDEHATPNPPPVDPRKPPPGDTPGSHSTGGARDHRTDEDSEGPAR